MANEIKFRGQYSGVTDYFTILRESDFAIWDTTGTPAFVTEAVANWANYVNALTESPNGGYLYYGNWPATLTTAGFYRVHFFRKAGANPAISDTPIGEFYGYWNGTKFEPAGGDIVQVKGSVPAALDADGNISANVKAVTVAPARTITGTSTVSYGEVFGIVNILTIDNSSADVVYRVHGGSGYLIINIGSNAHTATIFVEGFNGDVTIQPGSNPFTLIVRGLIGAVYNTSSDGGVGALSVIGGIGYIGNPTKWLSISKSYDFIDLSNVQSSADAAITANASVIAAKAVTDKLGTMVEAVP
jgi:hypothetical protein